MKALIKALALLAFLFIGNAAIAQSHILKFKSESGRLIRISFRQRFATIEVKDEASVKEAFEELRTFVKHFRNTHILTRIYPLFVISPEYRYFTYPLNRQKLNRQKI